jgi:coenzyme F420 hydrogenase subunit beta
VIKHGKFKVYVGSEAVIDVSLKYLDEYMSGPCKYCIDYTAEFADVSIGAIGSPDGWNTVIVRTAVGERLFESARKTNAIDASPIDNGGPNLAPLIRLAAKKKLQNNAYYLRRGIRPERLVLK